MMELTLNKIPTNGGDWEYLCIECYRAKYQADHFTEIPAVYKGDAGIEGFTAKGVVCQCYCPERDYDDNQLYEHQRDKMTKDLDKLVQNAKRLSELGVPLVHEWHFVIPAYRDSRILIHANTKKEEILKLKAQEPEKCLHISSGFSVYLKTHSDLKPQIVQILRTQYLDVKLNVSYKELPAVDWKQCESEKIASIRRKIIAVRGNDDLTAVERIVAKYAEEYLRGLSIIEHMRIEYPQFYEELYELQQAYGRIVDSKSSMSNDPKMNSELFNSILDDFGKALKEEFDFFKPAFILELQLDLVSGWLADCSLSFASGGQTND